MNKLLKLTGVSVVAIMTAMGANAAGYTCEELIEYTSCNAGYYLYTPTSSDCPDGYTYSTSYCFNYDTGYYPDVSQSECLEGNDGSYVYLGTGCADTMESPNDPYEYFIPETTSCLECPVGSICSGGTESATPCPAGSYCATTGLKAPTGLCSKGTFSAGGATAATCTSCPSFGMTDKDGNAVVTTTESTGSTSVLACSVGPSVYFNDGKGTYHFKSNCALDVNNLTVSSEEECLALGSNNTWDDNSEAPYCSGPGVDALIPTNEDDCNAFPYGGWDSESEICIPDVGEYWVLQSTGWEVL